MEYQIKINPLAQQDLKEIKSYISLDDPIAANKLVLNILSSIEKLSQFPNMGMELRYKINVNTKYRYIIVGSYMVFYLVKGNDILINRILNGVRDYKALFRNKLN